MSRLATPLEQEANHRALKELHRLFPRLPKADVYEFLMNNTAFPFAPLTYCVFKQCAELSKAAHKDVSRAWRISYDGLEIRETRKERKERLAASPTGSVQNSGEGRGEG